MTRQPDTIGGAFVQALAPDQYPAYADRIAYREQQCTGGAAIDHDETGICNHQSEPPAPDAADPWAVVTRLTAWLDAHNGLLTPAEVALRLLKVQEEAGEVASAWIGVTGQNPRKGVTHTTEQVADELCDVIVAAMVALTTLKQDPGAHFARKLAQVAALRLDPAGGES